MLYGVTRRPRRDLCFKKKKTKKTQKEGTFHRNWKRLVLLIAPFCSQFSRHHRGRNVPAPHAGLFTRVAGRGRGDTFGIEIYEQRLAERISARRLSV